MYITREQESLRDALWIIYLYMTGNRSLEKTLKIKQIFIDFEWAEKELIKFKISLYNHK